MNEFIMTAIENGAWAALFCVLFLYQLRDSKTRESKYMEAIAGLTKVAEGIIETTEEVKEISEDTGEILSIVKDIKMDTSVIKMTKSQSGNS